jgi:glycosyltransferase involved in cell wall biosynthesis
LRVWYSVVKLTGVKFIYIPSGCKDHVSKALWSQVDNGNVCGNCGYEPKCSDRINTTNFRLVRAVATTAVVGDGQITDEFRESRLRYKSIDLELYQPDLMIPRQFRLPITEGVRVLHSHSLEGRNLNGKNIKGTQFVISAVEKLKAEGQTVELVNLSEIPSRDMRYYQAQSDIVVDQLIYGGVGSTALECMSLGKPVICYLRPSWLVLLSSHFSEWLDCPIVSATPETVFMELKKLVVDEPYRRRVGEQSRMFAERFLDVRNNVKELEDLLESL